MFPKAPSSPLPFMPVFAFGTTSETVGDRVLGDPLGHVETSIDQVGSNSQLVTEPCGSTPGAVTPLLTAAKMNSYHGTLKQGEEVNDRPCSLQVQQSATYRKPQATNWTPAKWLEPLPGATSSMTVGQGDVPGFTDAAVARRALGLG